jgi:ribonuclease P protein component
VKQKTIKSIKGFGVFSEVWKAGRKIKKYPILASVVYDLQKVQLNPYRFEVMSEPDTIFIGVSVSKRRAKKAVVRNRVKRLMREATRLTLKEMTEQGIGTPYKAICLSSLKAPQRPKDMSLDDILPSVRKAMFAALENGE